MPGDRRAGARPQRAGGSPSARSRAPARAAADAPREDRHRESASPRRDRVGQRAEPHGGVAEVAVAEDEQIACWTRPAVGLACARRRHQRLPRGERAAPRPCRSLRLRTTRAPAARGDLGGGVGRAVVGDPDRRAGKRAARARPASRRCARPRRGRRRRRPRTGRGSVGGADYCAGPRGRQRWRTACGGSDD